MNVTGSLTAASMEQTLVDLDKLQWHKDYLVQLKAMPSGGLGLAVPKCEGALYFGHYISMDEYIEKYEAAINRNDKAIFE